MLAIRLPSEVEKRLTRLAKASGRTKTHYAREAILDRLEDQEDAHLAERRMREIYEGRSFSTPLVDVMRERGLL